MAKISYTGIPLGMTGYSGEPDAIIVRAVAALKRNGRGDLVEIFVGQATAASYHALIELCNQVFEVY